MESLEKPVVDGVLQAMAQAYPDAVDLRLLSTVVGGDFGALRAAAAALASAGLAQPPAVSDAAAASQPDAVCITDRGMAIACGLASTPREAAALLDRLEAQTLRALLSLRVRGSRLAALQVAELCVALVAVPDGALVDAARVCAHQPVSDWRDLIHALLRHGAEAAPPPSG